MLPEAHHIEAPRDRVRARLVAALLGATFVCVVFVWWRLMMENRNAYTEKQPITNETLGGRNDGSGARCGRQQAQTIKNRFANA